jgi:AP2-like factor (ANT lineage)
MPRHASYGEHHYLADYTDEDEAARAHDSAARTYHGDGAMLNFPEAGEHQGLAVEMASKRSKWRGVGWDKPRKGKGGKGQWRAQIQHRGKCKHLGYFTNQDEAARAYDGAGIPWQ